MKNFILLFLIFTGVVFASVPEKMRVDILQMGLQGSTALKEFIFNVGDGASNPKLFVDPTSTNKELTTNKSLIVQGNDLTIGDGAAGTNKTIVSDQGLGLTNPYHRYDSTKGRWVFSNDGSSEKDIGTGSGGGAGGINLLSNPSFEEEGSPALNWTCSGGTVTQETHTNGRDGNERFLRIVASGSGQYCESNLITVSDGLKYPSCDFDITYNQGDNSFKYQILNELDEVQAEYTVGDLALFQQTQTQNLKCVGGDQRKLRIVSTSAGVIDVDDSYFGSIKGVISSEEVLSCKLEGNDGRAITANTEDVYFDGTCAGWTSSGDDNYYTIQSENSRIELLGHIFTTANILIQPQLYVDRGSGFVLEKRIGDPDSQNNRHIVYKSTFGEFPKGTKLAVRMNNGGTLDGGVNENIFHYLNITETIEARKAITSDTSSFYADANIGGANLAIITGIPSQGSLDMVINRGSVNITCDDGSQGGLTCSTGNEQLGAEVQLNKTGLYRACFKFTGSSNNFGNAAFRVGRYQNLSDTLIKNGEEVSSVRNGNANAVYSDASVCGTFSISEIGVHTFKLNAESTDTSTISILADRNATENERDVNFKIERISEYKPSSILFENFASTTQETATKDFIDNKKLYKECADWTGSTTSNITLKTIATGLKPVANNFVYCVSGGTCYTDYTDGGSILNVTYNQTTGDLVALVAGVTALSIKGCLTYEK